MGKKYEIKNGYLFVDGKQVPYKPTPNIGGALKPEILVVHDTASGLNSSGPIGWLTNKQAKSSAHFVLGRDGDITQLVPTNRVAWHAGVSSYKGRKGANDFSVGIEIVNPGALLPGKTKDTVMLWTKNETYNIKEYGIKKAAPLPLSMKRDEAWWMPYTDAQIEGVLGIGGAIKDAYDINDVVAHWTVSPGRKVDTNPLFPLEAVKDTILKGQDMSNSNITIVKTGATSAEKEAAAAATLAKTPGENSVTTIKTEDGSGPAPIDAPQDLSPPSPIAGTPLDTIAASKVAPTDMNTVDPGTAPIMAPVDPTPKAPDPMTPNEKEIQKGRGKAEDKVKAIETLRKGLVTQDLNMRPWPDSPTVTAVIRVGAYVDIERETTSKVTGSKRYAIRVLPGALKGYVGKDKFLEGFVHSAFIQ